MVDYIDMKVKADVKNALEGTSVMDTLTNEFLQVTLFCLSKTLRGPLAESEVSIYNQDWQKIKTLSFNAQELITKPDTMLQATFDDLRPLFEVSLVEAQLSIDQPTLTISVSPINLSKEETEKVKPLLSSRTLLWNGKEF